MFNSKIKIQKFMLCFVLTNSSLKKTKNFDVFGSCFRMLAVILVSDVYEADRQLLEFIRCMHGSKA